MLSRKQMFAKLNNSLTDDVIVIHSDGCSSVIGFKNFVGGLLIFVKAGADDEMTEVDTVIHQMQKEARKVTKSNNLFYDLGNFTHNNMISQTNTTLLHLVSSLVSNGEVTKQSLSLTQSIKSHITGSHNETIWV